MMRVERHTSAPRSDARFSKQRGNDIDDGAEEEERCTERETKTKTKNEKITRSRDGTCTVSLFGFRIVAATMRRIMPSLLL